MIMQKYFWFDSFWRMNQSVHTLHSTFSNLIFGYSVYIIYIHRKKYEQLVTLD